MEHLSQNSQSRDKQKIRNTSDKTANRETEEAQNTSDRTADQEKEESKKHLCQIRHSLDTGKHRTPQSEYPIERHRKLRNISVRTASQEI